MERGWILGEGAFTDEGRRWRRDLEARTDELAAGPVQRFGDDAAVALLDDLASLVAATRARLPSSAPQAG